MRNVALFGAREGICEIGMVNFEARLISGAGHRVSRDGQPPPSVREQVSSRVTLAPGSAGFQPAPGTIEFQARADGTSAVPGSGRSRVAFRIHGC